MSALINSAAKGSSNATRSLNINVKKKENQIIKLAELLKKYNENLDSPESESSIMDRIGASKEIVALHPDVIYILEASYLIKKESELLSFNNRRKNFGIKLFISDPDRTIKSNNDESEKIGIISLLDGLSDKVSEREKQTNYALLNRIQDIKKSYITGNTYKIFKKDSEINKLCQNLETLKEGTIFYISLNYRVNNISTVTKKISELGDITGIFKVLAEAIIDSEDKCGIIGNTCASINEGLYVFLYLINNVFSSSKCQFKVKEIGNITMSNDMMIQKYKLIKHTRSALQNENKDVVNYQDIGQAETKFGGGMRKSKRKVVRGRKQKSKRKVVRGRKQKKNK